MAINIIENIPLLDNGLFTSVAIGSLYMQLFQVPDVIAFNTVAMILGGRNDFGAETSQTINVSLGLYSINAGTFSLANSALGTHTPDAGGTNLSWQTFVTSATQNISAGDWYLGVIKSNNTGGGHINAAGYVIGSVSELGVNPTGIILKGVYNSSTAALPTSFVTSKIIATSAGSQGTAAYVLISA